MNTEEKIFEIIRAYGFAESAKPTDHLTHDLEMDSLEIVELAMFVEEEFQVEFLDDVIAQWKTVSNIIEDTKVRI